jgi:circadian clock protein KaiB
VQENTNDTKENSGCIPSTPSIEGCSGINSSDVKYWLRLFVSSGTRPSQKAVDNIRHLSASLGDCHCEVIDIHQFPHIAEQERIVATPTLVRDFPLPKRKIIGDLADMNTVLLLIGT